MLFVVAFLSLHCTDVVLNGVSYTLKSIYGEGEMANLSLLCISIKNVTVCDKYVLHKYIAKEAGGMSTAERGDQ